MLTTCLGPKRFFPKVADGLKVARESFAEAAKTAEQAAKPPTPTQPAAPPQQPPKKTE